MIPNQFNNNPLIMADMQFRQQQPNTQPESLPSQDQMVQLAKENKLTHLGGKLPEFLKGILTEAKDMAKKIVTNENVMTIQNEALPATTPSLDINKAVEALGVHESRGATMPNETVAAETGATGMSQITPLMINHYNQLTGNNITPEQLIGNDQLQKDMTTTLVNDIMTKYKDGLENDWPTHTKKLTEYKQEIKSKFNEPIYWLAGEWVAGPNWVAKLDSPTAKNAKETVKDYIQRVGDIYHSQVENLALTK